MTSPGGILVVGSAVGERVESAFGGAEEWSITTASDADDALYHLATDAVDCVVASEEILEGESAFTDALAERPEIDVVAVPSDGSEPRPASENGSRLPSGVRGSIEEAVNGGDDADQSDSGMASPAPLVVFVADGSIIDATGPAMPPLGHEPEALVGESVHELVHPDDHETLEELLDDNDEDASGVLRFEHHDGDWREVRVDRRPAGPDRTRFDVYRRGVEIPDWFPSGEDAEEMLAVLYAHAPIHLYVKDEEGRHVWLSRYYSGDASDVIGKRDVDFDWGDFGEQTHAADMEVIESGEAKLNQEEYVPMHDDWNLTSKVPWTDEDGEVRGLVGVTLRMTKRKEYEQRLERENERLERFASIVSHDLRNPINVAMGNLELAREDGESEYLERIERALERMDRVTADVLTMAREGEWVTETERVSLETVARRAWDMVATADATLEIEADLTFEGDPDRLHHLFENLFRNAVEHGSPSPDSQARQDAAGARSSEPSVADAPEDAVEHGGDAVTVQVGPDGDRGFYVADDGVGMPAEYAAEAFETGQSASDGTGLGLAIVREVAEAHGWEVSVSESDDGGACFEVTGLAPVD